MAARPTRRTGEPLSQVGGVSGGTGIVYLGHQLGGSGGLILTYLAPLIAFLIGYALYRWDAWAAAREEAQAIAKLSREIEETLQVPGLTDEERVELIRGRAALRLQAARQRMASVRLTLEVSAHT